MYLYHSYILCRDALTNLPGHVGGQSDTYNYWFSLFLTVHTWLVQKNETSPLEYILIPSTSLYLHYHDPNPNLSLPHPWTPGFHSEIHSSFSYQHELYELQTKSWCPLVQYPQQLLIALEKNPNYFLVYRSCSVALAPLRPTLYLLVSRYNAFVSLKQATRTTLTGLQLFLLPLPRFPTSSHSGIFLDILFSAPQRNHLWHPNGCTLIYLILCIGTFLYPTFFFHLFVFFLSIYSHICSLTPFYHTPSSVNRVPTVNIWLFRLN